MSSRLCAVSRAPISSSEDSDLILPCEYCDVSSGYGLSAEQRLILALLTDAINVYQRGALSRLTRLRRLYVDAERWMLTDCADAAAFSFTMVCDALGINPELLRRRIIDWKHTVSAHHRRHPTSRLALKLAARGRDSHRRIRSSSIPAAG
jgi:hypothetical protein